MKGLTVILLIFSVSSSPLDYGRNEHVPAETASIVFGGDVSFDMPIRKGNTSACPYKGLMVNIRKYFQQADYAIANLECPFVTREMANETHIPTKGIHNKQWSESIVALTESAVDAVTLANNHLVDDGGAAVALTQAILEEAGIKSMGVSAYTPESEEEYTRQIPLLLEIKGIKIGVLAYCHLEECTKYRHSSILGQALYVNTTAMKDIADLKKIVDVVVVYMHWGTEYMAIPNESDRNEALFLVSQGVDLIMGSHPHVLQGHEFINNTLVKYSLGNFVFHAHFTYMGSLSGNPNAAKIQERQINVGKQANGNGPAGDTELFQVEFDHNGVVGAKYLPVRVHMNNVTGCLYPTPKQEDAWVKVCSKEDQNCFSPHWKRQPIPPVY